MEKSKITPAPIAVFAYNRPWHLKLTLQSLRNNILASDSLLYVFIDGPKKNASSEDIQAIQEVRKVAGSEKWCGEVIIQESSTNLGLATSVMNGVNYVLEKHEKIIVLEDDLVSDSYFLQFMNDSLTMYFSDLDVACISGYIYPVKAQLPETFFIKGADCWGWATWKRAWDLYNEDGTFLLNEIIKQNKQSEFDFDGSYPYVKMLQDQILGKNSSWAVRWYASAFLENKLCLYPRRSLIKNIGNDGSGTHSGQTTKFDNRLLNKPVELKKIDVKASDDARNAFIHYFKVTLNLAPAKNENVLSKVYRKIVPYPLRKWIYDKKHPIKSVSSLWTGNYQSWDIVKSECSGYDSELIFEKVKQATLQVKQGKASFERDSVLFHEPEFNPDFVEAMTLISQENNNQLDLIDFGGALGSVYFQYKSKFSSYRHVNWCVVEQEHFVEFGKKEMQDKELKFYYTIDECLKENKIQAILLSSVLSYIEKPFELLKEVMDYNFKYIIIDRNLFTDSPKDILTKQVVPESIYKASYPCWVLNKDKLITFIGEHYSLIKEFDPYAKELISIGSNTAFFKALIFKKRNT